MMLINDDGDGVNCDDKEDGEAEGVDNHDGDNDSDDDGDEGEEED